MAARQADPSSTTILCFTQAGRAPKQEVDTMVAVEPAKTTRAASENQDHVLAERKRREKLSEHFIALAKIVPGLKMDKVSLFGDAIKYVRALQERVKGMEEEEARRRPVVEAAVLVKKSRLLTADESFFADAGLPEIQARISSNRTGRSTGEEQHQQLEDRQV